MIQKNVPNQMVKDKKIILASSSPRRSEILKMSGLPFETKTVPFEETWPKIRPELIPEKLAIQKSHQVFDLLENEILITADTMVIKDSNILGKPKDKTHAISMLEMLAGASHKVLTGVAVREGNFLKTFTTTTLVKFDPIELPDIIKYVEDYNPLDKAGSYGIQEGIGLTHVKEIKGCFYNVMGLPMRDLFQVLKEFGVN